MAATGTPQKPSNVPGKNALAALLRQSGKEILKGSDRREFFHGIAKKTTGEAAKLGLSQMGVPVTFRRVWAIS